MQPKSMTPRKLRGAGAALVLASLLISFAAPPAGAQAQQEVCEIEWDFGGECELPFAGFPVTWSASWTPEDPLLSTDIHVEVFLRVGVMLFAPDWECGEDFKAGGNSCTGSYGPELLLPANQPVPVIGLVCLAHRHTPQGMPGSGTLRCTSG